MDEPINIIIITIIFIVEKSLFSQKMVLEKDLVD